MVAGEVTGSLFELVQFPGGGGFFIGVGEDACNLSQERSSVFEGDLAIVPDKGFQGCVGLSLKESKTVTKAMLLVGKPILFSQDKAQLVFEFLEGSA
jgi:hypothetical protein